MYKRNADLVYIIGLPGVPSSTKVWAAENAAAVRLFQLNGELGPVLKDDAGIRDAVGQHLITSGEVGTVEEIDFDRLV